MVVEVRRRSQVTRFRVPGSGRSSGTSPATCAWPGASPASRGSRGPARSECSPQRHTSPRRWTWFPGSSRSSASWTTWPSRCWLSGRRFGPSTLRPGSATSPPPGWHPATWTRTSGRWRVAAAWLARRGIAVGRRLAVLAATASLTAGRAGARAIRRGAPVVARSGGRLAVATGGALARAGGRGRDAVGRRFRRGDGGGDGDARGAGDEPDEAASSLGGDADPGPDADPGDADPARDRLAG